MSEEHSESPQEPLTFDGDPMFPPPGSEPPRASAEPPSEPPAEPAAPADPPAEPPARTAYLGDWQTREEAEAGFARFQQQLAESQRRESEANALLRQVLARPSAPAAPEEPDPASVAPPNPVEDPEGFAQWTRNLVTSTETRVRGELQQHGRQQDERITRDRLWDEFQRDYPEYAGMDDIAQIAFLQATGGTGQLPADLNRLKADVKARLDAMRNRFFPGTPPAASDVPPASTPPKTPATHRTAGVGEPTRTAAPPPAKSGGEEPIKTLADSIEEMQNKSGFF